MSSRYDGPDTLETEFNDLKRRLKALETSPRLPGLSAFASGGLVDGTMGQGIAQVIPMVAEANSWREVDSFGTHMPSITVTVGPTGRVLITYGAAMVLTVATSSSNVFQSITMQVGASGANSYPLASSSLGGLCTYSVKCPVSGSSAIFRASCSRQALLTDLKPGATTFSTGYFIQGNVAGIGAYVLDSPFLTVIPL